MNVREVIKKLEELAAAHGDDALVELETVETNEMGDDVELVGHDCQSIFIENEKIVISSNVESFEDEDEDEDDNMDYEPEEKDHSYVERDLDKD